jgi:hypothetical protein
VTVYTEKELPMNQSHVALLSMLCIAFMLAPAPLSAQSPMEQGTLDLSGSLGVSFGLNSLSDAFRREFTINLPGGSVAFDPGSNTKLNYGAAVGYAVRNRLVAVGEVVRTRIADSKALVQIGPVSTSLGIHLGLLEVTGGAQYELPVANGKAFPFVAGALGFARSQASASNSLGLDLDNAATDFTVNWGGGARIYIGPRWGIRPEFKVVHVPDETFFRAGVGVFYQFGR